MKLRSPYTSRMGICSKSDLVQDIRHKVDFFHFNIKLVMIGFSSSSHKSLQIWRFKWLTYGFQGKLKCSSVQPFIMYVHHHRESYWFLLLLISIATDGLDFYCLKFIFSAENLMEGNWDNRRIDWMCSISSWL